MKDDMYRSLRNAVKITNIVFENIDNDYIEKSLYWYLSCSHQDSSDRSGITIVFVILVHIIAVNYIYRLPKSTQYGFLNKQLVLGY